MVYGARKFGEYLKNTAITRACNSVTSPTNHKRRSMRAIGAPGKSYPVSLDFQVVAFASGFGPANLLGTLGQLRIRIDGTLWWCLN